MTTNIDLAKAVSSKVEIESVSIRQCSFRAGFEAGSLPAELALSQRYSASCDDSRLESEEILIVKVSFGFSARQPDEDEELEMMVIEADFDIIYSLHGENDFTQECLTHFADVNGPYNAWPYWRELVSSCSARVGLSSITVPVYRPRAFEIPEDVNSEAETGSSV